MKKATWTLVYAVLLLAFQAGVAGNALALDVEDSAPHFYLDHEDGWFWYKDPPPSPKEQQVAPTPPLVAVKPSEDMLVAKFEAYKKTLEHARIAAFFEPSPMNLTRYAALQTDLVKKSNAASDVWQRVIWANPEFDFTQERPVTRMGLNAYEANASKLRQDTLAHLAANAVLYFFFRADCPYCHEFAPTLARFEQATGIKVFPVSLDGGSLPEFPNPQLDNGMAATLGVKSWPALFLGEPAKSKITSVGFGVMSDMELADRLVEIMHPMSPATDSATPSQAFNPALWQ